MSEMVERLLPILIDATSGFSSGSMDYEGTLRRLIVAMREPTEAMMCCPLRGEVDDWSIRPGETVKLPTLADVWRAMIDEALKE